MYFLLMYVCVHVHVHELFEHVRVDVCTCVFIVYSVKLCAIHCASIHFVCVVLLSDHIFNVLKFYKIDVTFKQAARDRKVTIDL